MAFQKEHARIVCAEFNFFLKCFYSSNPPYIIFSIPEKKLRISAYDGSQQFM